jgi:hypothetical protein
MRPTVGDLTERWLDRIASRKSNTTRKMYESLADRHVTALAAIRAEQPPFDTSRTGLTPVPISPAPHSRNSDHSSPKSSTTVADTES